MQVLEELDETLELSGAKLTQGHAQLPLYRAPSLDGALSGRPGVRFSGTMPSAGSAAASMP